MDKVTSSGSSSESESESSLEVMGVVLGGPTPEDENDKECLSDERMEKMVAKYLAKSEKGEYKAMIRKCSLLFISNYKQILGVTVVYRHINLKIDSKLVAQK